MLFALVLHLPIIWLGILLFPLLSLTGINFNMDNWTFLTLSLILLKRGSIIIFLLALECILIYIPGLIDLRPLSA